MRNITEKEIFVWCVAFGTEAIVVTVGNLFIIFLFAQARDLRKRRYFFLLSLAVADLLVGIGAEPLFVYILGGFYGLWNFRRGGKTALGASVFVDMVSGISSIGFLAVVALERLYATLFPAKYQTTNKKSYAAIICAVWLASFAIAVARYLLGTETSLYVWMPVICVLLVIIGAAYAVIWAKILLTTSRRLQQGRERRFNLTVTILTLSSLSAWLPFIILNIANSFHSVVNPDVVHASKLLHYGNSLVNPFLFTLRMPKFRKAARALLCKATRANENQNRHYSHEKDKSFTRV